MESSTPKGIVTWMPDMEYIASSGLRSFLAAHKAVTAAGGTLEIINVQPAVQSVFDMTGFSVMLQIVK